VLFYYFQGVALGAALILPLGPQNALVLNQGIRRQYHLMIATLCAISDLIQRLCRLWRYQNEH